MLPKYSHNSTITHSARILNRPVNYPNALSGINLTNWVHLKLFYKLIVLKWFQFAFSQISSYCGILGRAGFCPVQWTVFSDENFPKKFSTAPHGVCKEHVFIWINNWHLCVIQVLLIRSHMIRIHSELQYEQEVT